MIYACDEADEARAIADHIGVLHWGRVEQEGTPEALLARPARLFVAELFGARTMAGVSTEASGAGRTVRLKRGTVIRLRPGDGLVGEHVSLTIRSEHRTQGVRFPPEHCHLFDAEGAVLSEA